jgi:hypothetical protein
MKSSILLIGLLVGVLGTSGHALAGGKRDGQFCHVSKSCQSKYCVTQNPADKFGVCCTPSTCPELDAQCGSIDNGCGVAIECGECGPGDFCTENNQCLTGPTTTTMPPTTTTTMPPTTTTTVGQTTTTTVSPTTTLAATRSCAGYCNQERTVPPGTGPDCYCDNMACSWNNNDGCPDFYPTCDVSPTWTCD